MENTESLKVSLRGDERGKGPARRLRAEGKIPGVVYGQGVELTHLAVDPKELGKRLKGPYGLNALFKLEVEGTELSPVVRVVQYQRDPVKRTVEHVDFHAVTAANQIVTHIPLRLEGKSVGVAKGGTLKQSRMTLKVSGSVSAIPTHITVDVSNLDVAQFIRVSTIQAPEGIEIVFDSDFSVATVLMTRAVKVETTEDPKAKKKKK
jgi:large subunit ribosomal protein L25